MDALLTTLGLVRFGFSLLFGIAVTALFAGIANTRGNTLRLALICVFFLCVQFICWFFLGIATTAKLYPLIIHLPLVVLFSLYYKRPWRISLVSVFSGYLCCQAPRWIGFLAKAALQSALADHVFYIIAVFFAYYILKRYVVSSVRALMAASLPSAALLGAVPLFYYAFDYITTIYTDVLYSGAQWAVQFMPSMISVFYFVFLLLYDVQTQKRASLQRERDRLNAQFRQAQTEFISLRQMQENAAAYRHDMRHHFALLQSLAAENRIEDIKSYLHAAQSDIEAITPVRFCEDETINLVLSSFASKAKQENIALAIDAKLPKTHTLSNTELCALLSNALENALHACKSIANEQSRAIQLRIHLKNKKLCIDMRNRYSIEPVFHDGLPVSKQEGHGFGAKSILHIVEKHGGVCNFALKDGWFIFQAVV